MNPNYFEITCQRKKLKVLSVVIDGEEYDLCDLYSRNMWASKKSGLWGKGLINTDKDKYKVERFGAFGEISYAKISGKPVDFRYIEFGDKQDFVQEENKIDFKIAQRLTDYKKGLVRATNDYGKQTRILDYFVFGFLQEEDIKNKTATIAIVGGCDKKTLMNRKTVPARFPGATHTNYEISYSELTPISEIINKLS